mmetsp:Transcript_7599/g.13979  ORF Transcript_7599/g.13979 Transcript_7599/m.13979 type:complete len:197 (+) Transcript_7599:279-869(+)
MSFTTPKLEKSNFQNAARHLSREISPIANRSAQMSWADVVASEPPSTAWADMMDDETSLQVEMDHENHHEQREKSTPLNGQKCILFTANVDEEQVTLTYNEVQALLKQRSTNNVSATTRRTKGSRKARKSKKRKGRRKPTITDSSESDELKFQDEEDFRIGCDEFRNIPRLFDDTRLLEKSTLNKVIGGRRFPDWL